MQRDVTVAIPTIPPRTRKLTRALQSVYLQTEPVAAVSIAVDVDREGAWATRNRAARAVTTTWTAFLDDDDELHRHHVAHLLDIAAATGADLAWGWFDVVGGTDPFPAHRGRAYDPAHPHIFPITVLARTELVHDAIATMGGFQPDAAGSGNWGIQDMPVWNWMHAHGATFHASDAVTWRWHHHATNTSGCPDRWPT